MSEPASSPKGPRPGDDEPRWRCRRCERDEVDARAFSIEEGKAGPPFLSPPEEPRPGVDRAEMIARMLWERFAPSHSVEFEEDSARSEYRLAARAILAALPESGEGWRPISTAPVVQALQLARWYVADHQEAQPNEETAGHLALIDAALRASAQKEAGNG